jgi:hypothetical protein
VKELQRLTVTFNPEGTEYAIVYSHADELPRPGTKTRTTRAARMARKALETALEGWVTARSSGVGSVRMNARVRM